MPDYLARMDRAVLVVTVTVAGMLLAGAPLWAYYLVGGLATALYVVLTTPRKR